VSSVDGAAGGGLTPWAVTPSHAAQGEVGFTAHLTHDHTLVDQFCEVSGGPCKLQGPSMKQVHEGFEIDRKAFNALVEVLQQVMDAQGIPFSAQNRLLAKLAPMHRDIINTP
jgi:truncated hemoglobin YjbI